ncbi:hypothetical protein MPSEU_000065800 [Mayamaea pseudoterrestris]|nr:hypothetical protein MPSEU_000065800 [Mayamaea pseudoterrestris]
MTIKTRTRSSHCRPLKRILALSLVSLLALATAEVNDEHGPLHASADALTSDTVATSTTTSRELFFDYPNQRLRSSGQTAAQRKRTRKANRNPTATTQQPTEPSDNQRQVSTAAAASSSTKGRQGLCVIGCTPYVELTRTDTGVSKYMAMVEEMAQTCDIVIHVGDTKPSGMACNRSNMVKSVQWMRNAAKRHGAIALYTPGDNELNDCHRSASAGGPYVQPADFYKAADARAFLVDALQLGANEVRKRRSKDLTLQYLVDTHFNYKKGETVPGTNYTYSCDFDKYVELDHYAVVTLEVPGSLWYLADETRNGYTLQDDVDPLMDRFGMYLNAMECAMDWIEVSALKASDSGKRAIFFTFQGIFYSNYGMDPISQPSGGFYSETKFKQYMKTIAGRTDIDSAYDPLFDKLTEVALKYPNLQFTVVHADGHRYQTLRMNSDLNNRGGSRTVSNQNLRVHMVEGGAKALTMWTRFTVDPTAFQPMTLKEEWSESAFNVAPYGHSWIPY